MTFSDIYSEALSIIKPKDLTLFRNDVFIHINAMIRNINKKLPTEMKTTTVLTRKTDDESKTVTIKKDTLMITDDDGGDWREDGFAAGQIIYLSGDDVNDNNKTFEISSITTVVSTNDTLVLKTKPDDQSSISVTICGFDVSDGYTWDNVNYQLTLKSTLKKLQDVFVNGYLCKKKGYDYITDDDYSDEYIYAEIERNKIQIATGLMVTDEDELQVRGQFDLSQISAKTDSTTISVPSQFEDYLIKGVIYNLLLTPLYRDETLMKTYEAKYIESLNDIRQQEGRRMPDTEYELDFKY